MVGDRTTFCFAAKKFKAVKLAAEHTPLVSKHKIPYFVPSADLTKVHPVLKNLFAEKIIPVVLLAGRLQNNFLRKTASEKNTVKYPHESSTGKSGGYGNFDMLTKGAISVVWKDQKKVFCANFS